MSETQKKLMALDDAEFTALLGAARAGLSVEETMESTGLAMEASELVEEMKRLLAKATRLKLTPAQGRAVEFFAAKFRKEKPPSKFPVRSALTALEDHGLVIRAPFPRITYVGSSKETVTDWLPVLGPLGRVYLKRA